MSKTADDSSSSDSITTVAKPAVNRRSEGVFEHRPPVATNRFWRLFSRREKVIENLKTLGWVIPITLIVWIYAEREQVVSPPTVSNVPILLRPDPGRVVEFSGNPDPTVNLKLTGPQQGFDRVRQQLTAIPSPLKIDVSNLGIGKDIPVNVLDRIQDNEVFKNNGVTVQTVDPSGLKVNIDRAAQAEVPVELPPDITNLSDVVFDPPKVMVHGPESELFVKGTKALLPTVKVFANLSGISQLKPGKHAMAAVPVSLSTPGKLHIDPGQTQVKADFTVQDADVSYTIPSMPIVLEVSPTFANTFSVKVNHGVESISDTRVIGPKALIDDLIQGRFHPKAVLVLDSDDDSPGPRKLAYKLPTGVTVDKEDEARTIDFEQKPRPSAE
jgi:hypothetical protein